MKFSPNNLLLALAATTNSVAGFGLVRPVARSVGAVSSRLSSSAGTEEEKGAATPGDDEREYDYDLLVIGGGSGGVRASRIASGYGAKVALLETRLNHGIKPEYSAIGGTCVNVGCVPKKLMVFASRYPGEIKEMEGYGWKGATAGQFDWKVFLENKNQEITRLNNVYQNFVLKEAGVEIIEARGSLASPNSVSVHTTATGKTSLVTAKNILIAVGGWPYKPDIPGIEHAITSNEIFYLEDRPQRMVVVGGGFIALEFASIMDGLGSDVTLMYRGDLFLRGFDGDMRNHLKEEMENNSNIDVRFNTDPEEIRKNDDGTLVVVDREGGETECDAVLYATGRKGKIDGLGLDKAGVETEGSFIPVDEYSRTNVPGVFAVGDITDRMALTPVALMEGHRLSDTLFGGKDSPVDHEYIASTVFTTPEIGTVGYTEEDAAAKFQDVDVYRNRFRAMKHSFPKSETYSLFKIIVESKTQRVVGCHVATDGAGEMVQGVA